MIRMMVALLLLVIFLTNAAMSTRLDALRAVESWIGSETDADLSNVEVMEVSQGNCGLVLKRDLAPGENALRIPRALCLSQRDGPETEALPAAAKVALRLCAEFKMGGASRFAPYLESLPPIDAPIGWSDAEADMLLGSRAFQARRDLLEEWRRESQEEDFELYAFCRAIVASRTYELPDGIGPVLIPFLDLANHDDNNFLALDVDVGDEGVVFALANDGDDVVKRGSPVKANYQGGGPIDPAKAIDIFGWIPVKDFCRIRNSFGELREYRPGDDLRGLSSDAREALRYCAFEALGGLDHFEANRKEALSRNSQNPRRRAFAMDVVQGEKNAWTALLATLQVEEEDL